MATFEFLFIFLKTDVFIMLIYKELMQFYPGSLGGFGEFYATLSSRSTAPPPWVLHVKDMKPLKFGGKQVGTAKTKQFWFVNFTLKSVLYMPFMVI